MRFKLDENLSPSWGDPLRDAGHDVSTAADESLDGAPDPDLARACLSEERCLITADAGFAQIIRYPPEQQRTGTRRGAGPW